MDSILTVKYKNGNAELQLILDRFLPTGKTKFRQLLKVLEMSPEAKEHYNLLKTYIEEALPKYEENIKTAAKCYSDTRQTYADATECLKSGKAPIGLPLSRVEIEDYKITTIILKPEIKRLEREFNKLIKEEKQYKGNLECLETWREQRC